MKCAACNGGLPPGKVIFCPPCFFVLPSKDQREMQSHYVRVCRAEKQSAISSAHLGIKAKVDKLVRKIRETRKLYAPAPEVAILGANRVAGDCISVTRLSPSFNPL